MFQIYVLFEMEYPDLKFGPTDRTWNGREIENHWDCTIIEYHETERCVVESTFRDVAWIQGLRFRL